MPLDTKAVVAEIDQVIAECGRCGHVDPAKLYEALALASSAIDRYATAVRYITMANDTLERLPTTPAATAVGRLTGILSALRADYAAGRLLAAAELIRADLFADFLSTARYFLDEGFKDPAAVIAGSALESHLRDIAAKRGVDTLDKNGEPKKAAVLNTELRMAGAYSLTDDKAVATWLDLRNHAAHGHFDKYVESQIRLMVEGVADFIARNPA